MQSLLTHEIYAAAAREAHRQNLPIVGHIPDHIKITEAVALGQKSIEHFMGVLEGCSSQEDWLLKGAEDTKLLLSSFDEAKCRKLLALLARTHTWQVPTMAWKRTRACCSTSSIWNISRCIDMCRFSGRK